MANQVRCEYGITTSFGEQVKQFAWHTGRHAAVAMTVSALFMYLLGEDDVTPGLINGGATALSLGVVHKLYHMTGKEHSSKDFKYQLATTGALALVNYFAVTYISKSLKYELAARDMLQQTAFSYIGILSLAYYLKTQADRRRP